MERSTVAGLAIGWLSLIIAHMWEAGGPASLLGLVNLPAALIVFGGTLGAALISFPMESMRSLPQVMRHAFRADDLAPEELVVRLVGFAEKARKEGLLSLESEVATAGDPFLKKGIQLVADGLDQSSIREMLETELDFIASRHAASYGVLEAMGGYAPTMGIIGTVMGLIGVLANLSDVASLGASIAVAFVATLYGVSSANLLWLPLGAKLKRKSEEELLLREVMIAGVISIQAGDNPQILEEKLKAYLPPSLRDRIQRPTKR